MGASLLSSVGRETLAIKTARMPVKNIPSNVPAPPIEAIGAPKPCNLSRFEQIRANECADAAADIGQRPGLPIREEQATFAVVTAGTSRGRAIPHAGHRVGQVLAYHGHARDAGQAHEP